jgi:hypothetical protein
MEATWLFHSQTQSILWPLLFLASASILIDPHIFLLPWLCLLLRWLLLLLSLLLRLLIALIS